MSRTFQIHRHGSATTTDTRTEYREQDGEPLCHDVHVHTIKAMRRRLIREHMFKGHQGVAAFPWEG